MPALKIFVSSTCYDLDEIRDRLGKFMLALGHEPIMSENGDVLYDPTIHTQTSCVEEVKNADMLVLIIGGRFGGKAVNEAISKVDFKELEKEIKIEKLIGNEGYSITHLEVLKAIELGIPVYTFIKKNVYNDHHLYEKNKNATYIDDIDFPSIEKKNTAKYIFEFFNIIRLRNHGNNIFPFEKENDIEETLKKQWSSYFQKLLKEQMTTKENEIITSNKNITSLERRVDQLQDLVQKLIEETPRNNKLQTGNQSKYRRILWVDDYPINNIAIKNFFENQGVHFDLALSTEEGIKLYNKQSYDIIITDMGRGHESDAGIDLIKKLKSLNCKEPIIVYCSRRAMERYGDEAIRLGAYRVMNGVANIIALITDIYGIIDIK